LYNDNGIKNGTEGFGVNIGQTLAQMTIEEKAALVSGTDFMYTNPIPRLGIPSLCMSDGPEKDNKRKGALFLRRILESNSLRSMSMTAGKSFPYNFAQGFVELTNGHLLKGAAFFLKKIKVPKLPKEE